MHPLYMYFLGISLLPIIGAVLGGLVFIVIITIGIVCMVRNCPDKSSKYPVH